MVKYLSLSCLLPIALALTVPGAAQADCIETAPSVAQAAIEDARRAVITLEYTSTAAKLDEVRRSLPCLTGTLPEKSIAQLYFFDGLLKFNLSNPEGGFQAFKDAAAVMPLLEEEREHNTEIRQKWAEARDDVTRTTGTLTLPNLPKDSVAYVNGRPLPSTELSTKVYPGVHLLQVQGDDRELHGIMMRVQPGETSMVSAEFVASLTPRGELLLDVHPRRSHVVVRQENTVIYDFPKAPRRQLLKDVKEGAYFLEVSRPGYFPFSQAKVAVEGQDQTQMKIQLTRRPSVSLIPRGGSMWLSGTYNQSTNPLASVELIGRTSAGWGVHLEYFHHILSGGPFSEEDTYVENERYDGTHPDGDEDEDEEDNFDDEVWVNGPPEFPLVTAEALPLGGRLYLGVSRQFRVEGVDLTLGTKIAMHLHRSSAFMELTVGYDILPWVGLNVRAGLGAMAHIEDRGYIYPIKEEEPLSHFMRFGMLGLLDAGIRMGF